MMAMTLVLVFVKVQQMESCLDLYLAVKMVKQTVKMMVVYLDLWMALYLAVDWE